MSVWTPSLRLSIWRGLVQVTWFELSTLHSKWLRPTPLSVPENANVSELDDVLPPVLTVDLLPSIAESIEVSGATVSTVQLNNAGEGFIFPELSLAWGLKIIPTLVKLTECSRIGKAGKLELSK